MRLLQQGGHLILPLASIVRRIDYETRNSSNDENTQLKFYGGQNGKVTMNPFRMLPQDTFWKMRKFENKALLSQASNFQSSSLIITKMMNIQ